MRLLLDECIPKRLAREFAEHDVRTVQQCGWNGLRNGQLLDVAQREFDALITVDQGVRFQQNIAGFDQAVVVLEASSNDIESLRPLLPGVRAVLPSLRPGQVARIGADEMR